MYTQVAHRFLRNQNHRTSRENRLENRANPFTNTLQILEDPQHQRRLFLIGTTHASSMLAQRTRELIREVKPDTVFVQTNEKWWNLAKNIEDVNNQGEFNHYNTVFRKAWDWEIENGIRNVRTSLFWLKFYPWLAAINTVKSLGEDFQLFTPGLEVKYAIEEAKQANAQLIFGGLAINNSDLQSLKVESRLSPITPLWRHIKNVTFAGHYSREVKDLRNLRANLGGEALAESFDKFRANFLVKYFEKISPNEKRILVDKKDEDIFRTIYNKQTGKNIVAVVNQWHMQGIETHWRHTTRTQIQQEPINPIGDFDLDSYYEEQLVNDYLRKFVSRLTKSEPATSKNYLTQYFKDCQEQERFRHVEFFSHDDPHMYHGSPYEDGYEHHHDRLPKEEQARLAKLQEESSHHHH